MDLDYVNKQIVCPQCGKKDTLYIDLNAIKTDSQIHTGIALRSHLHEDHLLLLDVDGNGDIRSINTISRAQELISQESIEYSLQEYIARYQLIYLFTNKTKPLHQLLTIVDSHPLATSSFLLTRSTSSIVLKLGDKQIYLTKDDIIPNQLPFTPELVILETLPESLSMSKTLLSFLQTAEKVVATSAEIVDALSSLNDQIHVSLVENNL